MKRTLKNVPTDKLNQLFDDLSFEILLNCIWAAYNGLSLWNVHYLI